MADAMLPPTRRDRNGILHFLSACPDCGAQRYLDKRRVHKPCPPCGAKRRRTHGLAAKADTHPLYRLLYTMKARCTYPSASNYAFYGGRGIKVYQGWLDDPASFVAWAEQSGYQPGLQIDRVDNAGDYGPDNCQWVTRSENCRNTRRCKCTIEKARACKDALASGATVKQAAAAAGIPYMVAWHISKGRSWTDA